MQLRTFFSWIYSRAWSRSWIPHLSKTFNLALASQASDAKLLASDWLVLSMHMQVILDPLSLAPGFNPYKGREEEKVQALD